jgi:hypothetical protein
MLCIVLLSLALMFQPIKPAAVGSALLVPLHASPVELTSAADGVLFDIDGDGYPDHVPWTPADSRVAFLAYDANGNGTIDSGKELFGNNTVAGRPNGFAALHALAGGGGSITVDNPFFSRLLLWVDRNHNGFSEASELQPASDYMGSIGLGYTRAQPRDGDGNQSRYRGWATVKGPKKFYDMTSKEMKERTIHIYDVFFAVH